MRERNRLLLVANLGLGPLIAVAPLWLAIPLVVLNALLGSPLPLSSELLSASNLLGFLTMSVAGAYFIGLVPALLHACYMMAAMSAGVSRRMLLILSPASGFLAVALVSAGLAAWSGEPFSEFRHLAPSAVGILPAFLSTLIAFRWMDRENGGVVQARSRPFDATREGQ